MTDRRLYFTLYVNCHFKWYVSRNAARAKVVNWIAAATAGQISGPLGTDVSSANVNYYLDENDEYAWRRCRQGGEDAFLYSRYLVEAEPLAESIAVGAYLVELRKVIEALESKGATVVAAGDYEDELNAVPLES